MRGWGSRASAVLALLTAAAALASASPAIPGSDLPALPSGSTPEAPPAPSTSDPLPAPGAGEAARETTGRGISLLAALGDAAGAVGMGLAAIAGGASAIGGALLGVLGALVGAVIGALGALAGGLGAALGLLGGAILWLLGALAGALAALAGVLGDLLGKGARAAADDPRLLAPVAAGGAALSLASLWRMGKLAPLVGLFSRLADHEILSNETRQRIFSFIKERPGTHISQVAHEMGLGWGTTVYHLNRLKEAQLVATRKVGNQMCHFVNGATHTPDEQRRLAATKAEKAQAIVQYLQTRGPTTQHAIAADLGMSSALVSWHAKRLEDHGVVQRLRVGRESHVALCAPSQVAARAAPVAAVAQAPEVPRVAIRRVQGVATAASDATEPVAASA